MTTNVEQIEELPQARLPARGHHFCFQFRYTGNVQLDHGTVYDRNVECRRHSNVDIDWKR